MSADSPRRSSGSVTRGVMAVAAIVPPQVVSDRSILDSAIGFINEVTLAHQPPLDPKDTITWARFETAADISDPHFGEDWELEGNVSPPLLLILGYGLGVQIWAIPANGEAVEVLSWRHGIVSALRVLPTPLSTVANEENGRADEPIDAFGEKRPLIGLVDGSSTSGSQPQFCAVNFVSLKTGAQVKTIKFKNPVVDILANRSSVVITFHERIAVFDARTLEDRLSITTCYPSPGINPNPAALGSRWLAYAENKLLHSKRSGGGCDGDGVASYTATVLNASKSLVKGLRELGEQVAAGLTGTTGSAGNSKNTSFDSNCGLDTKQAGIVTIIDVKNPIRESGSTMGSQTSSNQIAGTDAIIAHFIANSEALVAMEFDNSGMLLVTADRRGHDFHVFRIQPNPVGSSLAAVHHLYILHRGDTSAKVQNITLTLDSRWVAVSTLRGTTHVFPITPYGGAMGVRTHTSLHVVNKLSRFHRSAGLSGEARSNSPISHSESTTFTQSLQPYPNSTLPPFPRPTVVMPLAQLRQPFALGSPPGSATLAGGKATSGGSGSGSQRQRLSSLSDDNGKPLSVCAIFAKSRSWLLDPPNVTREAPHRIQRKAVDSLFVMAGHGALIQYDLGTKLASCVAKEKICDDTPIELEVEAKAQWNLGRRKEGSQEIMPPLPPDNWLIKNRNSSMLSDSTRQYDDSDDRNESWLSQVEIITHAGPHRRLWMGPQFVFKTYNTPSGSNLNHVDIEAVEIGTIKSSSTSATEKPDHSCPLNMPLTAAGRSSAVPVLIESGSYSSIEQSPKLMDRFRHDHLDSDYSVAHGDSRLKEDLADAMRESPSATALSKDAGDHVCESGSSNESVAFYDTLTTMDDKVCIHARSASAAALASVLPNIHSYDNSSSHESFDSAKKAKSSIEKIVNPLGTVTTVTSCLTADVKTDILDEVVSQLTAEDTIIHENCDESLFRPVVAIFCDEKTLLQNEEEARQNDEKYSPPEVISNKLVVPVIAKEVNDELSKREKEKNIAIKSKATVAEAKAKQQKMFAEMSLVNKKVKEGQTKISAKARICTEVPVGATNSQKIKSSVLKQESEDVRLMESVKNAAFLKETSAGITSIQKEILNKEPHGQQKRLTELHKQTEAEVAGTIQKIKPRTEFRNHAKKELQASFKESKSCDLNAKDIVTKTENIKTKAKTLSCQEEQTKEEDLRENIMMPKENVKGDESANEMVANLKCTASISSDIDNEENKSASNFSQKTHNLLETNTATIKEKIKNTKDSEEPTKLDTNSIIISKQFNVQQAPDENPVEIEESKKMIEHNVEKVTKLTKNKSENKKFILAANPSLCEKKDIITLKTNSEHVVYDASIAKDESQYAKLEPNKENNESKTSERKTSQLIQQVRSQKIESFQEINNEASSTDDCSKTKKSEKSKRNLFLNNEQTITPSEISVNRGLDLSTNMKPMIKDKNLEKIKCDSKPSKTQNEYKNKSNKTISNDKICENTGCNEQHCSDSHKQTEKNYEKNTQVNSSEAIDETKKITNQVKKVKPLFENKPENLRIENEINDKDKDKSEIEKKLAYEETAKSHVQDEVIEIEKLILNSNNKDLFKENAPAKMQRDSSSKIKTESTLAQEDCLNDFKRKEPSDIKRDTKVFTNETRNKTPTLNPTSPKKKGNEIPKTEIKKKLDLNKKTTSNFTGFEKGSVEEKECHLKKDIIEENKMKSKSDKSDKKLPSQILPSSAWKTLSGADIINRNLNKTDSEPDNFPLLEATRKVHNPNKLLPELSTPADVEKQTNLDVFSVLKPLDPLDSLPPLPLIESLHLIPDNKIGFSRDISLMTFESPLIENPSLQRKIVPAPRGFTEQNLILALCGSLHYENEHSEKTELSPTFSSNHSSTVFEDTSLADYKSLTENDDPYMSLEQSSQETNTTTTNTNTTNEKFPSSTNSSGSEEIVVMEEKKMNKKQKRKKQQQLKEFPKQKEQNKHEEIDDEELRPLIAMTDSQVDQATIFPTDTLLPKAVTTIDEKQSTSTQLITNSTTTDSDGPLPATTSDENAFCIPVPIYHNPHKIKTKKLEHKINLIAAIEAATSSSTSSAEESGVELGGRSSHDNGESLISVANSISTSNIPLPSVATSQTTVGALKKKTKRRKR